MPAALLAGRPHRPAYPTFALHAGRPIRHPWRPPFVPAALPATAGEYLGQWVRPRSTKPTYLKLAGTRTALLTTSTPLRVLGQQRERLRVELPDGRRGYVATRAVAVAQPLRKLVLPTNVEVQAQPAAVAAALAAWPARTPVTVLGRSAGYALVRGPAGLEGWARI